jgi:hypothetical protein
MGVLLLASAITGRAHAAEQDKAPIEFRSLLIDAGVSENDFALFEHWNGETSAGQAMAIARILYRLEQLDNGDIQVQPPAAADGPAGGLVRVEGRAVSAVSLALPDEVAAEVQVSGLRLCDVKTAGGERVFVISRRVPKAWLNRQAEGTINEPVRFTGVLLGSIDAGGDARRLILANRLQWYPRSGVSSGVAWLVSRGFDAALLDEVRQGQPFAKPEENREGRAFYACLAAVAGGDRADFMGRAREAVIAVAKHWKSAGADAAEQRKRLTGQLATTSADEKKQLERELTEVRRRQALAQVVEVRAKLGLSSVWPMFAEPGANVGRFFLIEGTARRAVRIVVDGEQGTPRIAGQDPAGSTAAPRSYYELDVFTTDAPQNHPVICCVPTLPSGFPTGEVIREPVRVAGVFFKRWAYARRPDADAADGDDLPERLAPPLLIAAEPDWLRTAAPTGPDLAGLWGGLGFVSVLGAVWFLLARASRRDRLARERQARYDAPLDNLAEP